MSESLDCDPVSSSHSIIQKETNISKISTKMKNETEDARPSSSTIRGVFLNWNRPSHSFSAASPASSENTSDSGQVLDMSPATPDDLPFDGSIPEVDSSVTALANSTCVYQMPIVGYEVQEERNRFTIFKIQVVHIPTTAKWYVFRRYTDFVRLNKKLRNEFPGLRFALPPKRWFGNNFDPIFLEDRQLGLQAFINNIIAHNKICASKSVRNFFCLDNPPSPHESLEESMALCHCLEQAVNELQERLHRRDSEIVILKSKLELFFTQQEALIKALRTECDTKDSDSLAQGSTHNLNLALLDICEETIRTQSLDSATDLSSNSNQTDRKPHRLSLSSLRKYLLLSSPASLPENSKEVE